MVDRRRPEYERLYSTLRHIRHEKRLTQAQLGARLGLPQAWVSSYEVGQRRLDVVELADIARALGVTVGDVLERAGIVGREPNAS